MRKPTHGLCNHPLYHVWANMKDRCLNENCSAYPNYGGRGITVCNEWQNSFEVFYNWATQHGWSKGLHLDRIENNGNYGPENCRFVSYSLNMRNKRTSVLVEYNGMKLPLMEWSERLGIRYLLLHNRLHRLKWSVEKSFTLPSRKSKYRETNG